MYAFRSYLPDMSLPCVPELGLLSLYMACALCGDSISRVFSAVLFSILATASRSSPSWLGSRSLASDPGVHSSYLCTRVSMFPPLSMSNRGACRRSYRRSARELLVGVRADSLTSLSPEDIV